MNSGRMKSVLKLTDIKKTYKVADTETNALKGISIEFRKNEFVSILGPSGCGKTTLLNIIGGLDRYSSGDLQICGRSTKEYKDSDWDTYRNHTIGFVFQSYNLIPHQSVLANVELALTLSGVSRSKRREKAKQALIKVGLGDHLGKKPNQMSGGQMQRVAIARALVNDPEILLADEPTGALDSETSVQIMDLLKEIANDRLVIMVTHNPQLAEDYSTRIIKLFDGVVVDDSNPYTSDNESDISEKTEKRQKKPSMSFLTAFSLSFNNLLTKKARTILTSFAGSIGIIGIALILSLSSGVQLYINDVEEKTLSSYPLTLQENTTDVSEMISSLMGENKAAEEHSDDKIYSNNIMSDMITMMVNGSTKNDLAAFKEYIEGDGKAIKDYTSDIKYTYSTELNIFTSDGYRVNPGQVFEKLGFATEQSSSSMSSMYSGMSNTNVWQELLDNDELLKKQYTVLSGRYPKSYNEAVVIVDKNNEISDYTLYTLGLKDADELAEKFKAAISADGDVQLEKEKQTEYSYDDILSLKFKLLLNSDYYSENTDGTWTDMSEDALYMSEKLKTAENITIVGILKANDTTSSMSSGGVGYLSSLMTHLIEKNNNSRLVKLQLENKETDIITGLPFHEDKDYTMDDITAYISELSSEEQAQFNAYIAQMRGEGLDDKKIVSKFKPYIEATQSKSSYEGNLELLGVSDINKPSGINIYPKDFEAKSEITELIDKYNSSNDEAAQIKYTDYIGLMMSSITTIINAVSYILIAFVSISLIVSSIMIGIITYISVLERTKEIGILRAMGASKRDVSRVFNAETIAVGLAAGLLGIALTLLLLIPINAIIKSITDISGLAVLPTAGAIVLVLISVFLTFIAGLIPSKIAARKEPVTSLRTE